LNGTNGGKVYFCREQVLLWWSSTFDMILGFLFHLEIQHGCTRYVNHASRLAGIFNRCFSGTSTLSWRKCYIVRLFLKSPCKN